MKKIATDKLYTTISKITKFFTDIIEESIKQFVGTYVGQRVFKMVTDFIIKKLFKEVAEPFMRVAVIRAGYYYDMYDAKDRIKKLEEAEGSDDEAIYYATLNNVTRR